MDLRKEDRFTILFPTIVDLCPIIIRETETFNEKEKKKIFFSNAKKINLLS